MPGEFPDLSSFLPADFVSQVKSVKIEDIYHCNVCELAACFPSLEKLALHTLGARCQYGDALPNIARIERSDWPDELLVAVARLEFLEIANQLPVGRVTIELQVTFGQWRVRVGEYYDEGFALDVFVQGKAGADPTTTIKPRKRWEDLNRLLADPGLRDRVEFLSPTDHRVSKSPIIKPESTIASVLGADVPFADVPIPKRVRKPGPTKQKPSPPPRWEDWIGDIIDDTDLKAMEEHMLRVRKKRQERWESFCR